MVGVHPHQVLLRGLWSTGTNPRRLGPNILQLDDQDFVSRLLAELKATGGVARLQQRQAATRSDLGALRLYQPVHRLFHLAVVDATCFQPGEPRLDPARITGAGLVIRRLDDDGEKAWVTRDGIVVGWQPLPADRETSRRGFDPDPGLRRVRRLGSNAAVLAGLEDAAPDSAGMEEVVAPLFVAPPESCAVTKRTILYGLVSVTSTDRAERPVPVPVPFDDADIRNRLPLLLTAGGSGRTGLPQTGATVNRSSRGTPSVSGLFATVDYLAREAGLFTDAPAKEALRKTLAAIPLERKWFAAKVTAGDFAAMKNLGAYLARANDILNGQPEGTAGMEKLPSTIPTPAEWPAISRNQENDIVAGIRAAMLARWQMLEPAQGRFDEPSTREPGKRGNASVRRPSRYVLRAFIRVPYREGCPPRTIWTDASEPFEIIPWHESSPVPPTKVELPEINRETLKKLRPNVAVKIPPSLQKLMDGLGLDKLMAGSVPRGQGEFGMICGFSIPIITLCAFIVLMIFLTLLDIIFWWLPYIRICIPYPKTKQ